MPNFAPESTPAAVRDRLSCIAEHLTTHWVTSMDRKEIENLLLKYKTKQRTLDAAWEKTADHGLMEFFVEITPRLLEIERCSIFVHDPSSRNVWVTCGTGLQRRQVQVPERSSMVGEVVASGKHQIRMNMEQSVGAHGMTDLQTGFTTHNALCVPIFTVKGDKAVGAIQVLNKQPGKKFSDEDVEILEKMARHLQIQIENIFLRQEIIKVSEKMEEQILKLERALNKAQKPS